LPTTQTYCRETLKYVTNIMKYKEKIKKGEIFNQKSTKERHPTDKTSFCSKHQETDTLIIIIIIIMSRVRDSVTNNNVFWTG
jgi:hypothetical protein